VCIKIIVSLEFCRLCLLCPLFSPCISYCICLLCHIFCLFVFSLPLFVFLFLCPFFCLLSDCVCRYPHCLFRLCRLLPPFISVYVLFFILPFSYSLPLSTCFRFLVCISISSLTLSFYVLLLGLFLFSSFFLPSFCFDFLIFLFPVFVLLSLTLVLIFYHSPMLHFVLFSCFFFTFSSCLVLPLVLLSVAVLVYVKWSCLSVNFCVDSDVCNGDVVTDQVGRVGGVGMNSRARRSIAVCR